MLHAQTADTWTGGTGNWSDGTFWNNGVPNGAAADVFIDGGNTTVASAVTINTGSYTVGWLTLDAGDSLIVTNGQSLTVSDAGGFSGAGTLANSGSVALYQGTSTGALSLSGNVSLTEGGTISLIAGSEINGNGGTLTNVDNTIEGYSSNATSDGLGFNTIAIVNQAAGTINANVSGQSLNVDPGSGGLTNAGLMEATNGGTLQINGNYGQGFTNTGAGTMQAMDGSTLLIDEASITGGTLSTSGTGLIQIYRGTDASGFTNVTSTGLLFVDGTVDLTGTFTNRGSVTFGSNGGNGGITIATVGDVSLNGGGTITLTSGSDLTGDGGTLTNVDNTIQGFGGLGSDQVGIVNGAAGVINANVSGQSLTVDPGTGGLTNAGLMEATDGGTLLLNLNNGQGFTNQGEYRVNDGSTITATQGGISNLVNGVLTGGTYRVLSIGSKPTTLSFGGNGVTANAATVVLSGINSVFADLGTLSDNRGSFSLLALRQFVTTGALSNEGNLVLDAGSTLHVAGAFTASGANASLDITVGGSATQGAQSPGILQVNGAASLAGNLAVAFGPGAALPAVGDTLTVIAAISPINGSFANAASGARLTTTDGKGSFLVNYGANSASPNAVTLSRFLLPGQTDLTSVSLVANMPTANANEGVDGTFLLTRTGDLSQDLYVTYTIKGSAANGADFLTLPTTKKIKAGKASKEIKITPVDQSYFAGGKKTVKLILLPESTYTVSGTPTAKVKIFYAR